MNITQHWNTTAEKPDFIIKFGLGILFIFITTSYFYLFRTGIPQVSGYIMAFGILVVFTVLALTRRLQLSAPHLWAGMFALWTFLINITHYLAYPDTQFFFSSLYYLYNASIFVMISVLFREAPLTALRVTYIAVSIALVVETLICIFYPNYENGRVQGSFQNPNQLAFWSLFSAGVMLLLRNHSQLRWYDILIFLGFGFLQTLALSKAGLISFAILAVGLPFLSITPVSYRTIMFFGALLTAMVSIPYLTQVMEAASQFENIHNVITRLENIGGEQDDSLVWRGYYRIFMYPVYTLIGGGEGGYDRFYDMPQPSEIHSTLINILFSYGIMGSLLFAIFLYSIVRKAPRYFLLILFVMMLNGLTHQNMRFSHFWVVLGVAYGVSYLPRPRYGPLAEPNPASPSPQYHGDMGGNTISPESKIS